VPNSDFLFFISVQNPKKQDFLLLLRSALFFMFSVLFLSSKTPLPLMAVFAEGIPIKVVSCQ